MRLHLVEASAQLKSKQQQTLTHHSVQWHDSFPNLTDDLPIICFGNEFFDALPIHQIRISNGNWVEVTVQVKKGTLAFGLSSPAPKSLIPTYPDLPEDSEGTTFETCPAAQALTGEVAARIARTNGAALFIDYGPSKRGFGDSFQAIRDHQFTDPLDVPGLCDLTAHVDFESLQNVALEKGCASPGIETQGRFLERLGIEARVLALSRGANESQQKQIKSAYERLVSTKEMGTLFKAFSFSHGMVAPPAGFGDLT
jgi:NADH dehydrogenase [ubiquinone] 1 alpha subcomplex assembly factor 7